MNSICVVSLFSADQRSMGEMIDQLNESGEREWVLSPRSVETALAEDPEGDLLLLQPTLSRWEWLALLLKNQRCDRPRPVVLYCPQSGVSGELADTALVPPVTVCSTPDQVRTVWTALSSRQPAPTVLFVDDDENLLKSYERGLRKSRWRIVTTSRGEEAVALVRQKGVDLVVTDIKMPDLHGFALISRIRKENQTLPIMVCSAYPGLRQEADLFLYKVAAFVEKPVNLETLAGKIEELIAG